MNELKRLLFIYSRISSSINRLTIKSSLKLHFLLAKQEEIIFAGQWMKVRKLLKCLLYQSTHFSIKLYENDFKNIFRVFMLISLFAVNVSQLSLGLPD